MKFLHSLKTALLCVALVTLPHSAEAADKKRVLIIVTSQHELMGTGKKTGFWFDEMATPYYAFKDAGFAVTMASIIAGAAPIDPESEKQQTPATQRFAKDAQAQQALRNTVAAGSLKADNFDAVLLAGGHGAMWDFVGNSDLNMLLTGFLQQKKIIASLGHGAAALLILRAPNGTPFVKGRTVACFTRDEEIALGLDGVTPNSPDTALTLLGAHIRRAKPFAVMAVRDDTLISGQNAASAAKTAKLVVEALKSPAASAPGTRSE